MNKLKLFMITGWSNYWDLLIPCLFITSSYLSNLTYSNRFSLWIAIWLIMSFYRRYSHNRSNIFYKHKKQGWKRNFCYRFFCTMTLIYCFMFPDIFDNPVVDFYETHIEFSCPLLKQYDNNYIISHLPDWYLTHHSLIHLIDNIDSCHLKDKKEVLLFIFGQDHLLRKQNPIIAKHSMYPYNELALPVKHALMDLYQQKLPVFNSYYPDNEYGQENANNSSAVAQSAIANEVNFLH